MLSDARQQVLTTVSSANLYRLEPICRKEKTEASSPSSSHEVVRDEYDQSRSRDTSSTEWLHPTVARESPSWRQWKFSSIPYLPTKIQIYPTNYCFFLFYCRALSIKNKDSARVRDINRCFDVLCCGCVRDDSLPLLFCVFMGLRFLWTTYSVLLLQIFLTKGVSFKDLCVWLLGVWVGVWRPQYPLYDGSGTACMTAATQWVWRSPYTDYFVEKLFLFFRKQLGVQLKMKCGFAEYRFWFFRKQSIVTSKKMYQNTENWWFVCKNSFVLCF